MAIFALIHEGRRSAIYRSLGLVLPAVFLLLQPATPIASTLVDPTGNLEIRSSRRATEHFEPLDYDAELSLSAGYIVFLEQDMSDTYGGLPLTGVEASLGTNESVRFVIGLGYGSRSGDPHYDSPEFEGGNDVKLKVVPITVGMRANISRNPRFRLYWGACIEVAWMEEKVPDIDQASGASHRLDRGWGKGFKFTLSPEWRSRDQRRALGLTFTWGGSTGEVGKGYHDHEVSLWGMGARLHYTHAL